MCIVIVLNKKSQVILRKECIKNETIYEIQKLLCKECPESVYLTFEGKVLEPFTNINSLGETILLVLEKEIDFNIINTTNMIKDELKQENNDVNKIFKDNNGKEDKLIDNNVEYNVISNENETKEGEIIKGNANYVIHKGKFYFVTKRKKRLTFKNLVIYTVENFNLANFIKSLLVIAVILSGNIFISLFIFFIKILNVAGRFLKKSKIFKKIKSKKLKIILMFFSSLVFIQHKEICK